MLVPGRIHKDVKSALARLRCARRGVIAGRFCSVAGSIFLEAVPGTVQHLHHGGATIRTCHNARLWEVHVMAVLHAKPIRLLLPRDSRPVVPCRVIDCVLIAHRCSHPALTALIETRSTFRISTGAKG